MLINAEIPIGAIDIDRVTRFQVLDLSGEISQLLDREAKDAIPSALNSVEKEKGFSRKMKGDSSVIQANCPASNVSPLCPTGFRFNDQHSPRSSINDSTS